jgi:L-ornithine N5-monooxygenase
MILHCKPLAPSTKRWLTFNGVNEIFDPERADEFYDGSAAARKDVLKADQSTNYSVVRLELLEQIYHDLYHQRIRQPDETQWQHRILRSREVTTISGLDAKNGGKLSLTLKNINPLRKQATDELQTLQVDAVLLATGYIRNAHEALLKPLEHLRPSPDQHWRVRRDYRVEIDGNKVNPDAGIWLQGCNESTHGLSDTLLSTLATRGGEMVESIFGTPSKSA